ncbi:MAG: hypothetical protein FJ060_00290 [Cyanobacteria bacterium K_Offshore_0m_m2_072]|nr:hypothetical protein [Cyanobacteria bacterium K_Offshore_0m_m2_072]
MTGRRAWWRRQTPTLVNLATVVMSLAQNLVFTALIARHWSAQALGQWLSLEAALSLLLVLPAILADLIGYELLRAVDPAERHGIYRQGTRAAYGLALLLLPATALLSLGHFPVEAPLLLLYAAVRLLGQPVLGAMGKRFYSDGRLSLCFSLGAIDQILLLAPAALVALAGGSFSEAIAWASFLRGLQALGQGALLQRAFPWRAASVRTVWTVPRLWRRMLLLAPASLPTPLIQNGITLITAVLLGQPQLAVFSTHRTAAGFLGQFGNALIEPRVPVMLRQPRPLIAVWTLTGRTLPLVAAAMPPMLVLFPLLYPLWLGGGWQPQLGLFAVLLLVQLLRAAQQPFAIAIRARNEPLSALAEGWVPLLLIYVLLVVLHPHRIVPFALILLAAELLQCLLRWWLLRAQLPSSS